jgi:hypothetical protein
MRLGFHFTGYETGISFTGQPGREWADDIIYTMGVALLAGQYQIGVLCTGQTDWD